MRLRKVEIFGFKSFPEKTTIHFQPGITCIVGPNGCGKSNILDSLLWAMGEQSTKTLRGERMEDVIFLGSESRKGLGMAEVTITIGDIKGELQSQYSGYSEIELTRRLFRSGESEYLINKVQCRLRDIKDILIDAGVGFKGHTVIEQGRVEKILTSTPEDRRVIIEDTAGIMKYKFRKTEALRKLEATQHNLLRVRDIISEVKRQISSLDRQVRKAREYQDLAGRIKEQEVTLHAIKYTRMEDRLKDLLHREDALRDKEIKAQSGLSNIEAEGEELRRIIAEDERNLNSLRQSLFNLEKEINALENRLILLENQITHQRGEDGRLINEIARIKEDMAGLMATGESFRLEKGIIEGTVAKGETAILEEERQYESASQEFHALQERLEGARSMVFGIVGKITEAKNRQISIQSRISELNRLKARLLTEHTEGSKAISETLTDVVSKEDIKKRLKDRLDERMQLMASLSDKLSSIERVLEKGTERLDKKREALHRNEARLNSLEEMERNLIGYQEGVRSILLSKAQNEASFKGIHGIVADFIDVQNNPPSSLFNEEGTKGLSAEKLIEAVLGERLQGVVVEDHGETKKAILFLRSNNAGRTTFIPKDLHIEEKATPPANMSGVVSPAMALVEYKEGYKGLVEHLLVNVMVVDNIDTALSLSKEYKNDYTFVTLNGEIVEPDGYITAGVANGKSQGLIEKRKELRILKGEVLKITKEVCSLEDEIERLKRERESIQQQIEEGQKEIRQEELSIANIEKDIEILREEEKRLRLREETLQLEGREIEAEITTLSSELNRCDEEVQGLVAEQSAVELEIQELIELQKTGRERWEETHKAITAKKLELATLKEKRESLSIQLRELAGRIELANRTISEKEEDLRLINQKIGEYILEKGGIELSIKDLSDKKGSLSKDIVDKEQERSNREDRLRGLEETKKESRKVIDEIQKEINQSEVQKAEIRLEMGHLKDTMYATYQIILEDESKKLNLQGLNIEELETTLTGLKERLNRMGPVNLASIEEYQELNQRYEFLTNQESDLTQACETLHKTISKINKTTREMFLNTFNIINEKFQHLFQLFFQGGDARLKLTDENNVLESGIEVFAQPPGKKVSQLALLSGGEKALTALSLLFATFLARPTPFCVLDEIDAPLDEANTERFIRTLKDMTGFSQFIVITHNKRTMEAADILYGITMEEPGVSRLVSINLARMERVEDERLVSLATT